MGSVDIDIRLQHMSRDYCHDIRDQRFRRGWKAVEKVNINVVGTVRYKC